MDNSVSYNNPMKYRYPPKAVKGPLVINPSHLKKTLQELETTNIAAHHIYNPPKTINDSVYERIETPVSILYNASLCAFACGIGLATWYATKKAFHYIKKDSL